MLFAEAYQTQLTQLALASQPNESIGEGGRDELDPLPRPGHY